MMEFMSDADDPTPIALRADLDILERQERLLRFPAFSADTAWKLGCQIRDRLLARDAGGTVEIELAGQLLFACATLGATPGQADWIRRKRNTVHRFGRSSYAVGRQLELDDQTLESRHGLTLAEFAAHGGGFPLRTTATGAIMVGSIVLSGLPQRDDHNLVAAAIAEQLGISVPTLP
jgi:uncharacterized protein (UPF0303 family)